MSLIGTLQAFKNTTNSHTHFQTPSILGIDLKWRYLRLFIMKALHNVATHRTRNERFH